MEQIQVVSFDLDGTLVEEAFDQAIWFEEIPQRYAARYALPLEEARERVLAEYRALQGHPRWTDMAFWFARFDLGDWQQAAAARMALIRPFPETIEVLQALSARYRLIVITQAERKFHTLKLEVSKLAPYFAAVFATPDHFGKLAKDESVYLGVLRRLKIAPAALLHVGDHPEHDYTLPRRLGIAALLLDRRREREGVDVIHSLRELLPRLS